MPLTDRQIRNAKYAAHTRKLFDGGGLYLELSPSGGKWWRFKYRFGVDGLPAGLALPPPAQRRMAAARDSAAARISAVEVSDRRRGLFR